MEAVSEMAGTGRSVEVPVEEQRVAARTAREEFLEPLMVTWPERGWLPVMRSFSGGGLGRGRWLLKNRAMRGWLIMN